MAAASTVEFAMNFTCNTCVETTEAVLSKLNGVTSYKVDLSSQSVVVTSNLPTSVLLEALETTDRRAVVLGMGGAQKSAVAMLGGAVGCGDVMGVVRFVQTDQHTCIIDGTVDGLQPLQQHGLAIHECGDLSRGCESVGEHYNPRNTRHGSPIDGQDERHVGDLGNITADSKGRAVFRFEDGLVKVQDIIGRSLAVASGPDDLGRGDGPMSRIDGNSGGPLSCGIIARSAGLFQNSKRICACDGVTLWDERDKPLVGPGRQEPPAKL